jgi:hypothetical protein
LKPTPQGFGVASNDEYVIMGLNTGTILIFDFNTENVFTLPFSPLPPSHPLLQLILLDGL